MDNHAATMPHATAFASITHEVRQPLCEIMMSANACLRMLTSDPPDIAGACEAARHALRDASQVSGTIAQLGARIARPSALANLVDPGDATLGLLGPMNNQSGTNHAAVIIDTSSEPQAIRDAYELLSRRECQVMQLVVAGLRNKQIAFELGISEITVKAHRGKVMRKMNAKSLAGLVMMAMSISSHIRA